jgi:hypothetical protein
VIDPGRAETPASYGLVRTRTRRACLPHSRALQCDEKAVTMRTILIVDDDKDAARLLAEIWTAEPVADEGGDPDAQPRFRELANGRQNHAGPRA